MFFGWPGNIYQTYLMQEYVRKEINCQPGKLATISVSAHLFLDQLENIKPTDISLIAAKNNLDYDLDKHVVGMKLNDEKEVKIKYPKDYQVEDLAGQKATYTLKITEINEMDLPALDDEFEDHPLYKCNKFAVDHPDNRHG